MAQIVAEAGLEHLCVRTLDVEGVFVLIEVDVGVSAEVDGIGTRYEGAVVVSGGMSSVSMASP